MGVGAGFAIGRRKEERRRRRDEGETKERRQWHRSGLAAVVSDGIIGWLFDPAPPYYYC